MTDDQRIRELAFLAAANPVGPTEPDYWKRALDRLDSDTFEKLCTEYGEDVSLKDTAPNVVALAVQEIRTRSARDRTTVLENPMAAQVSTADEAEPARSFSGVPVDAEGRETAVAIPLDVLCLDSGIELELFARAESNAVFARVLGAAVLTGDIGGRLHISVSDRELVFELVADEAGIYRLRDMSVGQYDAFMTQYVGK